MTVAPRNVTLLRDLVAQWAQAWAAGDNDEINAVGARLAGVVGALLTHHDAGKTT